MKNLAAPVLMLCLVLGQASQHACAGTFDVGLGLGFADSLDSEGFEGGWDFLAGYEMEKTAGWNIGTQLHFIRGWTDKNKASYDTSMSFNSTALYVTARPQNGWLQFKAGLVSADYTSLQLQGHGTGIAAGAGIVIGEEDLRLHLLDIHRFFIDGHSFNIYSISLTVLFGK
jgi:hypothetical protein